MVLDPNKRKAIYVVETVNGNQVLVQKRPKVSDRDKYRPFWEPMDFDKLILQLNDKRKVTLYKIENNKIKSIRVRKIPNGSNYFTSRDQVQEYLDNTLKSLDYTITRNNISVFYDHQTYIITASDKRFPKIKKACINDDIGLVVDLLNIKNKLKNIIDISEDNEMRIADSKLPASLSKKIVDTVAIYNDTKVLDKFKNRLSKNPSKTTREHLLEFLSYNGASLLEDGRFLAYKYVTNNYRDTYTGKFNYAPGKTVTMLRKDVVDDPYKACAAGLHVGSWGYSGSFDTVVLCVIDPVDVVSVPFDYEHQKIRCCKIKSIKRIYEPLNDFILPVSIVDV